jgi:hypothetical protein
MLSLFSVYVKLANSHHNVRLLWAVRIGPASTKVPVVEEILDSNAIGILIFSKSDFALK